MELFNATPYATQQVIQLDRDGRERLLVVVRATYSLQTGLPVLAEVQSPVALADEYGGEPDNSSITTDHDLCLEKPCADYAITGCAYPKHGKPAPEAIVSFRVGPLRKGAVVIGDRVWAKALATTLASTPLPFTRMPFSWERSFGGRDSTAKRPSWWPENPVGTGFRANGSRREVDGSRLPNVEDPAARMKRPGDRPRSVGFGPIAPWWMPRAGLVGTHDSRWQQERMPLPPEDFDPRFHHPVPHDQILPGYFAGGEPVILAGVRPDGGYSFPLPRLAPGIALKIGEQREEFHATCDTLRIDCESQTLVLVARVSAIVHGRVHKLRWLKITS